MVSGPVAFERINNERYYEDRLVYDIGTYFLSSLEGIPDLTEKQRALVHKYLTRIMADSQHHSALFNSIAQYVFERPDDQF